MITHVDAANKIDLETLSQGEPPFVSIYMQTRPGSIDQEKERLVFRNLVDQAKKSLEQEYDKRAIGDIITTLKSLAEDAGNGMWRRTKEGLAIFAHNGETSVYVLDYPVEESVVVANSLHIKPIIRNHQYGSHFYVLSIAKDRFDLLHGDMHALEAVELPDGVGKTFDDVFTHDDNHDPVNFGSVGSVHGYTTLEDLTDNAREKFFRYVNDEVSKILAPTGCPVILAALPKTQAEFREISSIPHLLKQGIDKRTESLSHKELHQEALDIIKEEQKRNVHELLERYGTSQAQEKASSDLRTIAQALVERKVEVLFVTNENLVPGTFNPDTGAISLENLAHPDVDDLTDDFAQAAYAQSAKVYVLEKELMPSNTGAAAIFRY